MYSFGDTGMEASYGMRWIDGPAVENRDGFFHQPNGGSRVGVPSTEVGMEDFSSGVVARWRESSQRQFIPQRRVLL